MKKIIFTLFLGLFLLLASNAAAGHCRNETGGVTTYCPAGPGFPLNGRWMCDKPGVDEHYDSGYAAGEQPDGACPDNSVAVPAKGGEDGSSAFDSIFGKIEPPQSLKALFAPGVTPDQAITEVLSKVIELIYIVAGIIFVLYILWGAIEFIYSEGQKEQVAEARRRIIYAIIGIVILSIAFVVLRVLGQITGFKFFE